MINCGILILVIILKIRQQYGIKNNEAIIALQCKSNVKLTAAFLYTLEFRSDGTKIDGGKQHLTAPYCN